MNSSSAIGPRVRAAIGLADERQKWPGERRAELSTRKSAACASYVTPGRRLYITYERTLICAHRRGLVQLSSSSSSLFVIFLPLALVPDGSVSDNSAWPHQRVRGQILTMKLSRCTGRCARAPHPLAGQHQYIGVFGRRAEKVCVIRPRPSGERPTFLDGRLNLGLALKNDLPKARAAPSLSRLWQTASILIMSPGPSRIARPAWCLTPAASRTPTD